MIYGAVCWVAEFPVDELIGNIRLDVGGEFLARSGRMMLVVVARTGSITGLFVESRGLVLPRLSTMESAASRNTSAQLVMLASLRRPSSASFSEVGPLWSRIRFFMALYCIWTLLVMGTIYVFDPSVQVGNDGSGEVVIVGGSCLRVVDC